MANDGLTRIPSFDLPVSVYLSEAAREVRSSAPIPIVEPSATYADENMPLIRTMMDTDAQRRMSLVEHKYPADRVESHVNGVPVTIITPLSSVGEDDPGRALIELHPGAFLGGAAFGLLEGIPLSNKARVKVVCVRYRLAPENRHPAAMEDVVAVYRELLRHHEPAKIGILGSSAGGLLAAQAAAAFKRHGLPRPGGLAIIGASADARFDGDSRYSNPASGFFPPPGRDVVAYMLSTYFAGCDLRDPFVSPAWSRDTLVDFPPTAILVSTRAHELSSALFTHRQLCRSGAKSELHVWDGLPHVFHLDARLPEADEVFDVLADFFRRHTT